MCLWMNPASRTVDIQGTSIEHFREAGAHVNLKKQIRKSTSVNLRGGRKAIGGGFGRGGRSLLGGGPFSSRG